MEIIIVYSLWLLLFFIGLFIYLLPAFIAHKMKHPYYSAILVMNIFLGWTTILWWFALIWALCVKKEGDYDR